jgi:hypothetical protein
MMTVTGRLYDEVIEGGGDEETRTMTSASRSPDEPSPELEDLGVQTILPAVKLPGSEPDRCESYGAGHNVHPIQARLAMQDPGIRGSLVRTKNGVALRSADGSEYLHLRCHRPEALEELLERFGPDGWRISACMLVNNYGVGISVAYGDLEMRPCKMPRRRTGGRARAARSTTGRKADPDKGSS